MTLRNHPKWFAKHAFGAILALSAATAGASIPRLECDGHTLTAHLARVPLAWVTGALASNCGIEVEGLWAGSGEEVSLDAVDLPVPQAIERLLRPRSFFLVTARVDGQEHVRRVTVLAGGPPPVAAVAVLDPLPPPFLPPDSAWGILAVLEASPDVADSPEEAAVVELATDHPDPATRREALLLLARRRDIGPVAKATLERAARHDTDPLVRDAARTLTRRR
jgi:hypothetical protein